MNDSANIRLSIVRRIINRIKYTVKSHDANKIGHGNKSNNIKKSMFKWNTTGIKRQMHPIKF